MHKIKLFILIFSTSLLFTACTKKEKPDEIVIKKYLEVEAVCTENNRNEKGLYKGYLAYVYNQTQQSGFRHGSVKYERSLNPTQDNYQVPSGVKFTKIKEQTFNQETMKLAGLSNRDSNRDVFKTICNITVVKRLDHPPK